MLSFLAPLLVLCEATFHRRTVFHECRRLEVSLIALEMLEIGGVIKHPWEVELQQRLASQGLDLGDAVLTEFSPSDRDLYFKALKKSGQNPSIQVATSMNGSERALFHPSFLWHSVATNKDVHPVIKSWCVRNLLDIPSHDETTIPARFISGFISGLSLPQVLFQLWQNPCPFSGGHRPNGPFANLLRQVIFLSEDQLLQGLPRFQLQVQNPTNSSALSIGAYTTALASQPEVTATRIVSHGADDWPEPEYHWTMCEDEKKRRKSTKESRFPDRNYRLCHHNRKKSRFSDSESDSE